MGSHTYAKNNSVSILIPDTVTFLSDRRLCCLAGVCWHYLSVTDGNIKTSSKRLTPKRALPTVLGQAIFTVSVISSVALTFVVHRNDLDIVYVVKIQMSLPVAVIDRKKALGSGVEWPVAARSAAATSGVGWLVVAGPVAACARPIRCGHGGPTGRCIGRRLFVCWQRRCDCRLRPRQRTDGLVPSLAQ